MPAAPDFGLIQQETGLITADAFSALWQQTQTAASDEARALKKLKDIWEPKVLVSAPSGNTDNLFIGQASVVHFNGATSFNLTGLVAPEPGQARVVIIHVSGAGTVTLKHTTTSTAANQLSLITAADTALATRKSAVFIYLTALWRQVV